MRRPSQALKSPTTLTALALGAQTAKRDALDPFMGDPVRAELLIAGEMVALGQQMQVEVAEHRRKR